MRAFFSRRLTKIVSLFASILLSSAANSYFIDSNKIVSLSEALVQDVYFRNTEGKGAPLNNFPDKKVYMARHKSLTREKLLLLREFGVPNLFQVGTSTQRGSGTISQQQVKVNSDLLGLEVSSLEPTALHAKYAVVDPNGKFEVLIPHVYGSVIYEFEVDRIRRRTTYTMSDSYVSGHGGLQSFMLDNDANFSNNQVPWHERGYIEAQIWGPISPFDIKAMYLEADLVEEFSDVLEELSMLYSIDIYALEPTPKRVSRVVTIANKAMRLVFQGDTNKPILQPSFSKDYLMRRLPEVSDPRKKSVILDSLGRHSKSPEVKQFLAEVTDRHHLSFFKAQAQTSIQLIKLLEIDKSRAQDAFTRFEFEDDQARQQEKEYLDSFLDEILGHINYNERIVNFYQAILKSSESGASLPNMNESDKEIDRLKKLWAKELEIRPYNPSYRPSLKPLAKSLPELSDSAKAAVEEFKQTRANVKKFQQLSNWARRALGRGRAIDSFLLGLSRKQSGFPNSSKLAAELLDPTTNSEKFDCSNSLHY